MRRRAMRPSAIDAVALMVASTTGARPAHAADLVQAFDQRPADPRGQDPASMRAPGPGFIRQRRRRRRSKAERRLARANDLSRFERKIDRQRKASSDL